MADNDKGIEGRPPDPFVAARINDPGAPAPASFQLSGLLGDSDRDGFRRLYLNTSLDYYVEFRSGDVLSVESVTADQPPFVGLDATRVTLTRDAQVDYIRSRTAAADPFAVNVQGGVPAGFTPDPTDPTITLPTRTLPTDFTRTLPESIGVGCVPDTLTPRCLDTLLTRGTCLTCGGTCGVTQCATCGNATCRTCFGATCQTCDQATCNTCDQATCNTCGQATCITCNAGATCHTCFGGGCWKTVGGATCATCLTCQATACNWTCNWNCQSVATPCVTQQRCPTLICP